MKKVIILRGNSASGKTSVAKELQERLGCNTLMISQDMIRRDILHVKDGPNTLVIPLLTNLVEYGHQHTEITILEGIFKFEWYEPFFNHVKDLFGDEIYAYYWDIPFEETLRRHQTKIDKAKEYGATAMHKWWREKDYLTSITETIFHENVSLEEAVNHILQDLDHH